MPKIQQVLLAIYSFIFAPLIVLALVCSYMCRRVVDTVLRIRLRDKYAGLLDGMDCVWSVEESEALSVNNILLILEKDARHSNVNFLESFRDLAQRRLLASPFEKLLYKRKKKLGYYYWERSEEINLKDRVRWLEYERTNCDGSCDNVYNGHLKRVLSNVCNQPLPENHTASWEILIGKCCPRSSHHYLRRLEEHLTSRIKIPVLFRVHHSLGDGMSLLKFFREVIVDKEPIQETCLQLEATSLGTKSEDLKNIDVAKAETNLPKPCLIGDRRVECSFPKEVMSASMPFIHFVVFSQLIKLARGQFDARLRFLQNVTFDDLRWEMKAFLKRGREKLANFILESVFKKTKRWLWMAKTVADVPACLIQQAFRSMDKRFIWFSVFHLFLHSVSVLVTCLLIFSALHGAELTGEKLVSYWLEDDFKNPGDQKLFTKIQNIKSITGARFGDVLLAALSVSLQKYFLRVGNRSYFKPPFKPPSILSLNNFDDAGERSYSDYIERRSANED